MHIYTDKSVWTNNKSPDRQCTLMWRFDREDSHSVWVRSEKNGTTHNYNMDVFTREWHIETPQEALERGWQASQDRWEFIDSTHSWKYGHNNVVCIFCGKHKGDPDLGVCQIIR